MDHAIETRELCKTFRGGVQALRSVDLVVKQGSCFGLLGPNGAGKSTLVKSLLSIVRPTSGYAAILGRDIRDSEARRGVGYLPEGHRFPRYLTGAGVCRYFGKLSGLDATTLAREIPEKLALVGMTEWADVSVTKYSKGMMQRVGLAQAMLGNPRVIFLDEPTDGVDPVGRHELRAVIRDVASKGTTILMNSHLLSEVELVCDEIAILHKGQIIERGSVSEIKQRFEAGRSSTVYVTFKTGTIPDALWTRIAGWGAVRVDDETFTLRVPTRDDISPVIDELRRSSVSIYAIERVAVNLEDAFIKLIQDQAEQGVGGTQA